MIVAIGATALAGLGAPTDDCCCATCEPVGVRLLFRQAIDLLPLPLHIMGCLAGGRNGFTLPSPGMA